MFRIENFLSNLHHSLCWYKTCYTIVFADIKHAENNELHLLICISSENYIKRAYNFYHIYLRIFSILGPNTFISFIHISTGLVS